MKTILSAAPLMSGILIASCGGDKAGNTNKAAANELPSEAAPADEELVKNPAKPPEQNFTRQDFEGIGTIELPSGMDWKREGNKISNPKWGMIIVIQSQPQSMVGQEADYLNSYNEVNIRDAEGWKRGRETLGRIKGVKAARTEGSFNNGTAMVTRDYIFFEARKTAIIQTRITANDKDFLAPMADYIAGSYQQQ